MTTLQKLARIEKKVTIYDIHFCNAGVGFKFFEPPPGCDDSHLLVQSNWRDYLVVHKYFPTFVKAVAAEYDRIFRKGKS